MQIHEFLGVGRAAKTEFMARPKSLAKIAKQQIQRMSPRTPAQSPLKRLGSGTLQASEVEWQLSRVEDIVHKICFEIAESLSSVKLGQWVRKYHLREAKMAGLFCFSAWLAPVIPDYSDMSCYSKTTKSKIYRTAAEQMPRLILEAAFGDSAVARHMQSFMKEWEEAETSVKGEDLRMLQHIEKKDRGPFLYWLVNERGSIVSRRCFARVCACRSPLRPCTLRLTRARPRCSNSSLRCATAEQRQLFTNIFTEMFVSNEEAGIS